MLPDAFDGLTVRQYQRLELFAAKAIAALDVVPTTEKEVGDG